MLKNESITQMNIVGDRHSKKYEQLINLDINEIYVSVSVRSTWQLPNNISGPVYLHNWLP